MTPPMTALSKWWSKERVDRFEKDTSQDFCPTNGGAFMWVGFWVAVSLALFLWGVLQ